VVTHSVPGPRHGVRHGAQVRCCARSCRYYSFTQRSLCFADMRDRLRRRQYRTWGDLLADFELICDNALAYNNRRSRVHRAAVTLQHAGRILLQV
jgi:Bromodomain